jgi:hypothetical protein
MDEGFWPCSAEESLRVEAKARPDSCPFAGNCRSDLGPGHAGKALCLRNGHPRRVIRAERDRNGGFGVWVLAGVHSSNLYVAISRYSNVGMRLPFVELKPAVTFYFDIDIEFLVLCFNMTALWTAHPEHVKIELEIRVRSFPPSFLLAPGRRRGLRKRRCVLLSTTVD